jgi:hypothetical protein
MKNFNLLIVALVLLALPMALNSCKEDAKVIPDAPSVAAPAVTTAATAAAVDITFQATIPGGFTSAAVTATGGTATVKTPPAADALTGSVVVTFTAGATPGAASVELTITDKNNKVGKGTGVINITVPGAPSVTAPAAATPVTINVAKDITFAINASGGYKSSALSGLLPGGSTAVIKTQPAAGAKTGDVVVTYTSSVVGQGAVTLTVTDNNNITGFATAVTSNAATASVTVNAAITANTTWTADRRYTLIGNIYVRSGATLTIEAGTVIFGDKVTKGSLVINRGAKIQAVGTAAKPIVFTSSAPKGFRNTGDWGGIVILGKANNNQSGTVNIEGITATGTEDGVYGGTDDADDSGALQYVRIEFAGIALSTNNELNSLTLGSVGSATKINNIQVSYGGDDAYEWFGGKVNSTYLISYRTWDDDFDTDFGYTGFNQFGVSFRDPGIADVSGSNIFEADNDANGTAATPLSAPTFANYTIFGPYMFAELTSGALDASKINPNYRRGGHLRRNSNIKIYNSIFVGLVDGILFDKTGSSAVFKGNYLARISGNVKPTVVTGNGYNDSAFATDNTIAATANAVDQTAILAGSTANLWSISAPTALLATNSALLTGATTLPTFPTGFGFSTPVYRGAFDATNNWANSTWTNYTPINTDY